MFGIELIKPNGCIGADVDDDGKWWAEWAETGVALGDEFGGIIDAWPACKWLRGPCSGGMLGPPGPMSIDGPDCAGEWFKCGELVCGDGRLP